MPITGDVIADVLYLARAWDDGKHSEIIHEALSRLENIKEELKQAYALGIYKGTDGLLRNSWQQRVEELERENKRLQELLDMANLAVWHDRM